VPTPRPPLDVLGNNRPGFSARPIPTHLQTAGSEGSHPQGPSLRAGSGAAYQAHAANPARSPRLSAWRPWWACARPDPAWHKCGAGELSISDRVDTDTELQRHLLVGGDHPVAARRTISILRSLSGDCASSHAPEPLSLMGPLSNRRAGKASFDDVSSLA